MKPDQLLMGLLSEPGPEQGKQSGHGAEFRKHLFFFFKEQVMSGPGWLLTHYIAEDNLNFLLLSIPNYLLLL